MDIIDPSNTLWNSTIRDSKNCKIRPTFYVTEDGTDYYNYLNLLQEKTGEIGLHSKTHTTNLQSNPDYSFWFSEF